ncbi:MAG: hypothetical protein MUD01_18790 [Chloroflexaceae bacterium]|nr:hypothetical protein [Chloroflexaceae bacterium]
MKTVVGIFDNYAEADHVVAALKNKGFARNSIAITARDELLRAYLTGRKNAVADDAGAGAMLGTIMGTLVGILALLGLLTPTIFGPGIANGNFATIFGAILAAAGVGAAIGAIIGALVGMAMPRQAVHFYTEGTQGGGVVVTARVNDDAVLKVMDAMRQASGGGTRTTPLTERAVGDAVAITDTPPASEPPLRERAVGEPRR